MGLLTRGPVVAPLRPPPTRFRVAVMGLLRELLGQATPVLGPMGAVVSRAFPSALDGLSDAQLRDALTFVREQASRLLEVED